MTNHRETPEEAVLRRLRLVPKDIDDIIAEANLSEPDAQSALVRLEIRGLIRRLPRNCYVLASSNSRSDVVAVYSPSFVKDYTPHVMRMLGARWKAPEWLVPVGHERAARQYVDAARDAHHRAQCDLAAYHHERQFERAQDIAPPRGLSWWLAHFMDREKLLVPQRILDDIPQGGPDWHWSAE